MNSAPASRNIELKARYGDLRRGRELLAGLELREGGIQTQIDTYFPVPNGRLKLREIVGIKAELIWYERSNEAKSRQSDYRLAAVANAAELKAALVASLGLRGEVRKSRHILLWENVRIHLDEVEGLGRFVEFEAVVSDGADEQKGHEQLARLCRMMMISPGDYLEMSYADLAGLKW